MSKEFSIDKKKEEEILGTFLCEIKNKLGSHLKQIILFGSRARGDNEPYSDFDFLAIMDEVAPFVDEMISEITGEFFCKHSILFFVLPVTEKRFSKEIYNPLFMNIRKEGVDLL